MPQHVVDVNVVTVDAKRARVFGERGGTPQTAVRHSPTTASDMEFDYPFRRFFSNPWLVVLPAQFLGAWVDAVRCGVRFLSTSLPYPATAAERAVVVASGMPRICNSPATACVLGPCAVL